MSMLSPQLMPTYARLPVAFVRGEGSWMWDVEGRKYLDALSGIAVNTLGHGHPKLVEGLREQVGQLIHTSNLPFSLSHSLLNSLTPNFTPHR